MSKCLQGLWLGLKDQPRGLVREISTILSASVTPSPSHGPSDSVTGTRLAFSDASPWVSEKGRWRIGGEAQIGGDGGSQVWQRLAWSKLVSAQFLS